MLKYFSQLKSQKLFLSFQFENPLKDNFLNNVFVTSLNVQIQILQHSQTLKHTYSCTHILRHTHTRAHTYSCTHISMHTHTHAHTYSCTHILMHTHNHAHIYSCTQTESMTQSAFFGVCDLLFLFVWFFFVIRHFSILVSRFVIISSHIKIFLSYFIF